MEFTLKTKFKTSAKSIYEAWMSSEGHTKMTGGAASINDEIGSEFIAWDGYIFGENQILETNKRIVQSWRTTEFEDDEADSKIEILLNEENGVTELTLTHTNLPKHGEQYRNGWQEHYFIPMKDYFSDK